MIKSNTKALIIASFIPKTNIHWFFNYINENFELKKGNIHVYEIEENSDDYLVTFKVTKKEKIDLKFHFKNATIVNAKHGCIFSINALNRLIEKEANDDAEDINYERYKIDWDLYINKLLLCNKGNLVIKNIKKIDIFEKNL